MKTFITQLCGPINTIALLVQKTVAQSAKQVDILPMSLFHFDARQEPPAQLNSRLDGIIGGIAAGDSIIVQTPLGMSRNYAKLLFDKLIELQAVMGIKLIAVVEDIFTGKNIDLLDFYRHCDALVAPGTLLLEHLQQIGISKEKLIPLPYYDFEPTMMIADQPQKADCLSYLNGQASPLPSQFEKIDLPAFIFQNQSFSNKGQLHYQGRIDDDLLVNKINQNGGWGLIWPTSEKQELFLRESIPLEMSIYFSAGIPVIAKSNTTAAALIAKKKLGFVVEDLDEAVTKIRKTARADYQKFLKNVAQIALISRHGIATEQALIRAVFQANLPKVKENKQ